MKIILHGFGTFSVFFYHVIKYSRKINEDIEWYIILTTPHFYNDFVDLLGLEHVFLVDVNQHNINEFSETENDPDYYGPINEDIAAEKRPTVGSTGEELQHKAKYLFSKELSIFEAVKPNVALVSQVEGLDGKVFIRAAQKFGSKVVVPTGLRNVGGIYFSEDENECLPIVENYSYFLEDAQSFIEEFRKGERPAWNSLCDNSTKLSDLKKPITYRIENFVKMAINEKGSFKLDRIRTSFLNNFPRIRDLIWAINEHVNSRYFNIGSLKELPNKFIFYPLQYTPESSINTPAAYFVDQMRAIDAIRFSMPPDYTLIVKEHPSCIKIRDSKFTKQLLKTAGVLVAKYNMNTSEIIDRADITVSVTGTAIMEAYFKGKPSIALAHCLPAAIIGGATNLSELKLKIMTLLEQASIPEEEIYQSVAKLLSLQTKSIFSGPGLPNEPALREGNIALFFEGFIKHCNYVMR